MKIYDYINLGTWLGHVDENKVFNLVEPRSDPHSLSSVLLSQEKDVILEQNILNMFAVYQSTYASSDSGIELQRCSHWDYRHDDYSYYVEFIDADWDSSIKMSYTIPKVVAWNKHKKRSSCFMKMLIQIWSATNNGSYLYENPLTINFFAGVGTSSEASFRMLWLHIPEFMGAIEKTDIRPEYQNIDVYGPLDFSRLEFLPHRHIIDVSNINPYK